MISRTSVEPEQNTKHCRVTVVADIALLGNLPLFCSQNLQLLAAAEPIVFVSLCNGCHLITLRQHIAEGLVQNAQTKFNLFSSNSDWWC